MVFTIVYLNKYVSNLDCWTDFESFLSYFFFSFYLLLFLALLSQSLIFFKFLKGRVQPPSPLGPPILHWYWLHCKVCTNRFKFVTMETIRMFSLFYKYKKKINESNYNGLSFSFFTCLAWCCPPPSLFTPSITLKG